MNASTVTVLQNSGVNVFSPESTASSQISHDAYRDFAQNHERKMVLELVDRIFDEQTGIYSVSSSACLTPQRKSAPPDYDKRLKYWKDMLEERKRITERIQQTIGRPAGDVLFNRSTVDCQEKNMVKRVLDYSERMNPLTLASKHLMKLREYCQLSTCLNVNELYETLPRAEREEKVSLEITGVPAVTKQEQFGPEALCKKKSPWLESKVLEKCIEDRREDIERVIEFYPDIDNLAVVGEGLLKNVPVRHNSEIELINEDVIKTVSTETSTLADECKQEVKLLKAEPTVAYGIKVNEHSFIMGMKRSAQYVEIEVRFECYPFETVMKRVLHLENLGQKILNIELVQRNYFPKVQGLLRANDHEFVMDVNPFRLIAGEKRDIVVLYQPRKVDVVKQQWLLKVDPQFFCRKTDAIVLKLSGRCKAPVEYVEKITTNVTSVIEKSNMKMMRKLGNNLSTLTPLIKPDEVVCPYKRTLDEREIFEQLNVGYACERYHDLELLKDVYKRVKKPREPAWDFKLDTLFELVMRLESADRRALIFNEIMGILECMKGKPIELETKIEENPERERTRFLFVRGVVSAGIEEWEDMALSVEETFVNQAIKIHHAQAKELASADRPTSPQRLIFDVDEEELRQLMIKKVRRQKPFRDSLFVQTYTLLCNFVEDIVSVIESTEFE